MSAPRPFQDKPIVRVEQLSVARGGRPLFTGLSFVAAPGAFVEIVGGNGSGKTTLLRTLAGFLKPRAGRVMFEGVEEPALALHYVAHLNALKGAASVRAHLAYWADLFGGAAAPPAEALERLGIAGLAERPARTLSQGQARRLALSRLVLAPRPIWLLDEPAAGLDAAGRDRLADMVEAHRAAGGCVIAALHEPLGPTPDQTLSVAQ